MLQPDSSSVASPAPPTNAVDCVEDDYNFYLPAIHFRHPPPTILLSTPRFPLMLPSRPHSWQRYRSSWSRCLWTWTYRHDYAHYPRTRYTSHHASPLFQQNCASAYSMVSIIYCCPRVCFWRGFCTASTPLPNLCLSTEPSSGGNGAVVAQPRPASKWTVNDLLSWLEAWNGYVATFMSYSAASLLAYNCQDPLHSPPVVWLRYDSCFRTLAAKDKSLR